MIIRDVPANLEDYYMASDEENFRLQQMGITPKFFDGDVSYYKKSNKLKKALIKLGIEV